MHSPLQMLHRRHLRAGPSAQSWHTHIRAHLSWLQIINVCVSETRSQFESPFGCFQKQVTPKSSISMGFSIINHPFWSTPIFGTPISIHFNPFHGSLSLDILAVQGAVNQRILYLGSCHCQISHQPQPSAPNVSVQCWNLKWISDMVKKHIDTLSYINLWTSRNQPLKRFASRLPAFKSQMPNMLKLLVIECLNVSMSQRLSHRLLIVLLTLSCLYEQILPSSLILNVCSPFLRLQIYVQKMTFPCHLEGMLCFLSTWPRSQLQSSFLFNSGSKRTQGPSAHACHLL